MSIEIKALAENFRIVPINEIYPDPSNTNTHPQEQIDMLIEQFKIQGFRDPLIVDKGDGLLVCGEGRLIAAKKAGLKELPVIYQEFESIKHKKAFITSHNATQNWSSLDLLKVNDQVIELGPDFDISWLAIKDFVIEPIEKFEPQSDEDEVPEVTHPITRRGDIWLLGNHRLMCGDSTMIDDVEKLMNGEKADMVFTDPPYGVDYKGINNDSRDGLPELLDEAFCNYIINTKPGAAIYCFHSDKCADIFHEKFRAHFHFSSMIIWVKPSLVMGQSDYQSRHEPCLYGWNPSGKHKWFSDRKQTSIWEYGRDKTEGHTTPKPVAMIEKALLNSSELGSLVIDLFLGSGSTLIACEKTNRKCYGMELDEKYCDVIINRWQNYTGKKAVLESTKQTYEELKLERGE